MNPTHLSPKQTWRNFGKAYSTVNIRFLRDSTRTQYTGQSIGYWMSDKPLIQQALSSELAELLLKIQKEDTAFGFLRGFWQSIVREWHGIDRLR
jgi:hypothetical protein